jgi:hypothetical protein
VVQRGRKRSCIRLKTEMQVSGLSCDDGPEWEGWSIGPERNFGDQNAKLLLEYTTQEDIGR